MSTQLAPHHNLIRRAICLVAMYTCGCADSFAPPSAPNAPPVAQSEGRGVMQRYVAIGTSVSMGWRSDGVVASSQATSWPAQLARMGHREMTLPYIAEPGCRSPLLAPLATGRRTSGEAAGADPSTFACAESAPGVELPPANLAISAATTYDALYTTPERQTDVFYSKLYPRILLPGETQVSAMMAQNPKLVSVELGGNEVLNARSGIAIEGLSMYPYAAWEPLYDQVLDSVARVAPMAVVVGLVTDVGNFPGFRRGWEMWADRAAFAAAFNVEVSANCDGSANLLFVPVIVPTAVGNGLYRRAHGYPAYTLSCAAGAPTTGDYILDPAEALAVNTLMKRMDDHIRAEAERRGYAFFRLGALYDAPDIKGPFSAVQLMTSQTPYGSLIGLDGIHPSEDGSTVLALAAAAALDARYGFGIVSGDESVAAAKVR